MKNGKRFLAAMMAAMMMLSVMPAAAAAQAFQQVQTYTAGQFSDVANDQWYAQAVEQVYALGLMSGDTASTFRPAGQVTLAEAVTVAARIHALATTGTESFVQGTPWYQVYTDYALQNGILAEVPADYSKAATRLEFARILAKALPAEDLAAINQVDYGMIPDVADDESVYLLYRAGVLTGSDNKGTFLPDSTIQRCEMAAIVVRMALPELRQIVLLGTTSGLLYTPGATDDAETEDDSDSQRVPVRDHDRYDEDEDTKNDVQVTIPSIPDYMDENNALTKPFDEAHPDLFASGEVGYSGEQIMIKVEDSPSGAQQQKLARAGVDSLELIMELESGSWYKAYVSGEVTEVMKQVRELRFVKVAEYDFAYTTGSIIECNPEDLDRDVHGNADFDQQWYLCSCGIKHGWDHLKHPHHRPGYDEDQDESTDDGASEEDVALKGGGNGVVVAVIDTGVDYTHEDLKDNIWINRGETPDDGIDNDGNGYIDDYYGYNAVTGSGSAMDDNGHGTHVAGIIGAVNNNTGVVGVAYNAQIMPIKAGMASGYFNQSDIAEAIMYAAENGADVINMSFGGSASSIAVQDALEYAYTRCVLVAAAGNDGYPNEYVPGWPVLPTYPAALTYVVGVTSVNTYGVESAFSNWDVAAFNSIEYEVAAPGEEILSTLPGNRYASWSGTSMAAPVVSGMAALLREEYRGLSTYPTKFIYGQLCSTGTETAECCMPEKHGLHNLPKIVDIYNALTVLPTPEVSVSDYRLFDTKNLKQNEKNNGDGVIDAGETIALGFMLRNRWGMSEDTVVAVDTLSVGGMEDPYITIHNESVNYGSVGTYSTQDAGRILDEDDVFIGWEKPIYITIAEDCPHDYIATLNITVTCANALDQTDDTVYESYDAINLYVRRGVILPNIIDEDMTLTADNYYIIPNATLIKEGATVTVEAGTQIQFWTDDPHDAYADTAITYLTVEGEFICEGTPEERVRLFPSELMDRYRVEIRERNAGCVKLFYTDVVNPYFEGRTAIAYAEGCEFRQNYLNDYILYRNLQGGDVFDNYGGGEVAISNAVNCAFYKLGNVDFKISGNYTECIFVDCALQYGNSYNSIFDNTYENCVFYGNNTYLGTDEGFASTMKFGAIADFGNYGVGSYGHVTYGDSKYIIVSAADRIYRVKMFAEYLGGHVATIDSPEELDFFHNNMNYSMPLGVALKRNMTDDSVCWEDGRKLGDFLSYRIVGGGTYHYYDIAADELIIGAGADHFWADYVIEIPQSAWSFMELTDESAVVRLWTECRDKGLHSPFHNNVILNRLVDDDVSKWMRIQGLDPTIYGMEGDYALLSLDGNYWDTTSEFLIGKQILDFDDYQTLTDLDEGEYLTEAPEDVWPFVVNAGLLDSNGEEADVIGNEKVTFYVEFNRDMDTSINLDVRFGSYYPYADYQVEGEYVSDRRWEGTTTLTTLIENGYQFWSISNGCAADEPLKLYEDWGRFSFEIDTSNALAMTLQGTATNTGIELTWVQDDFDTLAGYNIYRADQDEDAYYQRLNNSILPVGEEYFFDDTVEPGKVYYYKFTVVKTDMSESEPSGKKMIMSRDTMAPELYHTPLYQAYAGSNLVISATAIDNLALQEVTLHYRTCGDSNWTTLEMSALTDKYSVVISGNLVTVAGIEYYITAFDGISTTNRGTARNPFVIEVQEPLDTDAMGDVDGNGRITIVDALMVLQAINNRIILDKAQFDRADLNGNGVLNAAEALTILQYANGEIGSLR